jgi:hypothetical protein
VCLVLIVVSEKVFRVKVRVCFFGVVMFFSVAVLGFVSFYNIRVLLLFFLSLLLWLASYVEVGRVNNGS